MQLKGYYMNVYILYILCRLKSHTLIIMNSKIYKIYTDYVKFFQSSMICLFIYCKTCFYNNRHFLCNDFHTHVMKSVTRDPTTTILAAILSLFLNIVEYYLCWKVLLGNYAQFHVQFLYSIHLHSVIIDIIYICIMGK